MQSKQYPLGETIYYDTLPNGLDVVLLPKPGFKQSFVTFSTKYGSIDNRFRTSKDEDFLSVPDGIAHFLEHKMFESEEGDVFPHFARGGASANAFTTFDQTTYLFSCTENLRSNTELLLDFVQDPFFTVENVEKEKGIIGQEIEMYNDNPDARIFYELLKALYVNNPVRIDVAGTVASIQEITKDTLYACYNTFYHPGNMTFFAVGGFDVDEMMQWIMENQAKKTFSAVPDIDRPMVDEPDGVNESRVESKLAVSGPRVLIGWKDAPGELSGNALLEQEMTTAVALDALFGKSSEFYHRAIDEGLIDSQFSWEYERARTYGFSVIGGNTQKPDELVKEVQACLDAAAQKGLVPEDFERSRRKALGRFFGTLDMPSVIARGYVGYRFRGADMFDTVPVLEGMTIEKANARLAEHFTETRRSVSIVHN